MKRILTVIVSLALLGVPSAALASSSTCQSYNAQLCDVAGNTNSQTPGASPTSAAGTSATATNTASTLPFTGLDVGLLVAGGGVLLAAGLVVRRVSRDLQ